MSFFSPLPALEAQFGLWSTNPEQVYQTNKKREGQKSSWTDYIHFNALYLIIFFIFYVGIIIKITKPITKCIHVFKTKIVLYGDIMSLLRVQNPVDSNNTAFLNKNTIAAINYWSHLCLQRYRMET